MVDISDLKLRNYFIDSDNDPNDIQGMNLELDANTTIEDLGNVIDIEYNPATHDGTLKTAFNNLLNPQLGQNLDPEILDLIIEEANELLVAVATDQTTINVSHMLEAMIAVLERYDDDTKNDTDNDDSEDGISDSVGFIRDGDGRVSGGATPADEEEEETPPPTGGEEEGEETPPPAEAPLISDIENLNPATSTQEDTVYEDGSPIDSEADFKAMMEFDGSTVPETLAPTDTVNRDTANIYFATLMADLTPAGGTPPLTGAQLEALMDLVAGQGNDPVSFEEFQVLLGLIEDAADTNISNDVDGTTVNNANQYTVTLGNAPNTTTHTVNLDNSTPPIPTTYTIDTKTETSATREIYNGGTTPITLEVDPNGTTIADSANIIGAEGIDSALGFGSVTDMFAFLPDIEDGGTDVVSIDVAADYIESMLEAGGVDIGNLDVELLLHALSDDDTIDLNEFKQALEIVNGEVASTPFATVDPDQTTGYETTVALPTNDDETYKLGTSDLPTLEISDEGPITLTTDVKRTTFDRTDTDQVKETTIAKDGTIEFYIDGTKGTYVPPEDEPVDTSLGFETAEEMIAFFEAGAGAAPATITTFLTNVLGDRVPPNVNIAALVNAVANGGNIGTAGLADILAIINAEATQDGFPAPFGATNGDDPLSITPTEEDIHNNAYELSNGNIVELIPVTENDNQFDVETETAPTVVLRETAADGSETRKVFDGVVVDAAKTLDTTQASEFDIPEGVQADTYLGFNSIGELFDYLNGAEDTITAGTLTNFLKNVLSDEALSDEIIDDIVTGDIENADQLQNILTLVNNLTVNADPAPFKLGTDVFTKNADGEIELSSTQTVEVIPGATDADPESYLIAGDTTRTVFQPDDNSVHTAKLDAKGNITPVPETFELPEAGIDSFFGFDGDTAVEEMFTFFGGVEGTTSLSKDTIIAFLTNALDDDGDGVLPNGLNLNELIANDAVIEDAEQLGNLLGLVNGLIGTNPAPFASGTDLSTATSPIQISSTQNVEMNGDNYIVSEGTNTPVNGLSAFIEKSRTVYIPSDGAITKATLTTDGTIEPEGFTLPEGTTVNAFFGFDTVDEMFIFFNSTLAVGATEGLSDTTIEPTALTTFLSTVLGADDKNILPNGLNIADLINAVAGSNAGGTTVADEKISPTELDDILAIINAEGGLDSALFDLDNIPTLETDTDTNAYILSDERTLQIVSNPDDPNDKHIVVERFGTREVFDDGEYKLGFNNTGYLQPDNSVPTDQPIDTYLGFDSTTEMFEFFSSDSTSPIPIENLILFLENTLGTELPPSLNINTLVTAIAGTDGVNQEELNDILGIINQEMANAGNAEPFAALDADGEKIEIPFDADNGGYTLSDEKTLEVNTNEDGSFNSYLVIEGNVRTAYVPDVETPYVLNFGEGEPTTSTDLPKENIDLLFGFDSVEDMFTAATVNGATADNIANFLGAMLGGTGTPMTVNIGGTTYDLTSLVTALAGLEETEETENPPLSLTEFANILGVINSLNIENDPFGAEGIVGAGDLTDSKIALADGQNLTITANEGTSTFSLGGDPWITYNSDGTYSRTADDLTINSDGTVSGTRKDTTQPIDTALGFDGTGMPAKTLFNFLNVNGEVTANEIATFIATSIGIINTNVTVDDIKNRVLALVQQYMPIEGNDDLKVVLGLIENQDVYNYLTGNTTTPPDLFSEKSATTPATLPDNITTTPNGLVFTDDPTTPTTKTLIDQSGNTHVLNTDGTTTSTAPDGSEASLPETTPPTAMDALFGFTTPDNTITGFLTDINTTEEATSFILSAFKQVGVDITGDKLTELENFIAQYFDDASTDRGFAKLLGNIQSDAIYNYFTETTETGAGDTLFSSIGADATLPAGISIPGATSRTIVGADGQLYTLNSDGTVKQGDTAVTDLSGLRGTEKADTPIDELFEFKQGVEPSFMDFLTQDATTNIDSTDEATSFIALAMGIEADNPKLVAFVGQMLSDPMQEGELGTLLALVQNADVYQFITGNDPQNNANNLFSTIDADDDLSNNGISVASGRLSIDNTEGETKTRTVIDAQGNINSFSNDAMAIRDITASNIPQEESLASYFGFGMESPLSTFFGDALTSAQAVAFITKSIEVATGTPVTTEVDNTLTAFIGELVDMGANNLDEILSLVLNNTIYQSIFGEDQIPPDGVFGDNIQANMTYSDTNQNISLAGISGEFQLATSITENSFTFVSANSRRTISAAGTYVIHNNQNPPLEALDGASLSDIGQIDSFFGFTDAQGIFNFLSNNTETIPSDDLLIFLQSVYGADADPDTIAQVIALLGGGDGAVDLAEFQRIISLLEQEIGGDGNGKFAFDNAEGFTGGITKNGENYEYDGFDIIFTTEPQGIVLNDDQKERTFVSGTETDIQFHSVKINGTTVEFTPSDFNGQRIDTVLGFTDLQELLDFFGENSANIDVIADFLNKSAAASGTPLNPPLTRAMVISLLNLGENPATIGDVNNLQFLMAYVEQQTGTEIFDLAAGVGEDELTKTADNGTTTTVKTNANGQGVEITVNDTTGVTTRTVYDTNGDIAASISSDGTLTGASTEPIDTLFAFENMGELFAFFAADDTAITAFLKNAYTGNDALIDRLIASFPSPLTEQAFSDIISILEDHLNLNKFDTAPTLDKTTDGDFDRYQLTGGGELWITDAAVVKDDGTVRTAYDSSETPTSFNADGTFEGSNFSLLGFGSTLELFEFMGGNITNANAKTFLSSMFNIDGNTDVTNQALLTQLFTENSEFAITTIEQFENMLIEASQVSQQDVNLGFPLPTALNDIGLDPAGDTAFYATASEAFDEIHRANEASRNIDGQNTNYITRQEVIEHFKGILDIQDTTKLEALIDSINTNDDYIVLEEFETMATFVEAVFDADISYVAGESLERTVNGTVTSYISEEFGTLTEDTSKEVDATDRFTFGDAPTAGSTLQVDETSGAITGELEDGKSIDQAILGDAYGTTEDKVGALYDLLSTPVTTEAVTNFLESAIEIFLPNVDVNTNKLGLLIQSVAGDNEIEQDEFETLFSLIQNASVLDYLIEGGYDGENPNIFDSVVAADIPEGRFGIDSNNANAQNAQTVIKSDGTIVTLNDEPISPLPPSNNSFATIYGFNSSDELYAALTPQSSDTIVNLLNSTYGGQPSYDWNSLITAFYSPASVPNTIPLNDFQALLALAEVAAGNDGDLGFGDLPDVTKNGNTLSITTFIDGERKTVSVTLGTNGEFTGSSENTTGTLTVGADGSITDNTENDTDYTAGTAIDTSLGKDAGGIFDTINDDGNDTITQEEATAFVTSAITLFAPTVNLNTDKLARLIAVFGEDITNDEFMAILALIQNPDVFSDLTGGGRFNGNMFDSVPAADANTNPSVNLVSGRLTVKYNDNQTPENGFIMVSTDDLGSVVKLDKDGNITDENDNNITPTIPNGVTVQDFFGFTDVADLNTFLGNGNVDAVKEFLTNLFGDTANDQLQALLDSITTDTSLESILVTAQQAFDEAQKGINFGFEDELEGVEGVTPSNDGTGAFTPITGDAEAIFNTITDKSVAGVANYIEGVLTDFFPNGENIDRAKLELLIHSIAADSNNIQVEEFEDLLELIQNESILASIWVGGTLPALPQDDNNNDIPLNNLFSDIPATGNQGDTYLTSLTQAGIVSFLQDKIPNNDQVLTNLVTAVFDTNNGGIDIASITSDQLRYIAALAEELTGGTTGLDTSGVTVTAGDNNGDTDNTTDDSYTIQGFGTLTIDGQDGTYSFSSDGTASSGTGVNGKIGDILGEIQNRTETGDIAKTVAYITEVLTNAGITGVVDTNLNALVNAVLNDATLDETNLATILGLVENGAVLSYITDGAVTENQEIFTQVDPSSIPEDSIFRIDETTNDIFVLTIDGKIIDETGANVTTPPTEIASFFGFDPAPTDSTPSQELLTFLGDQASLENFLESVFPNVANVDWGSLIATVVGSDASTGDTLTAQDVNIILAMAEAVRTDADVTDANILGFNTGVTITATATEDDSGETKYEIEFDETNTGADLNITRSGEGNPYTFSATANPANEGTSIIEADGSFNFMGDEYTAGSNVDAALNGGTVPTEAELYNLLAGADPAQDGTSDGTVTTTQMANFVASSINAFFGDSLSADQINTNKLNSFITAVAGGTGVSQNEFIQLLAMIQNEGVLRLLLGENYPENHGYNTNNMFGSVDADTVTIPNINFDIPNLGRASIYNGEVRVLTGIGTIINLNGGTTIPSGTNFATLFDFDDPNELFQFLDDAIVDDEIIASLGLGDTQYNQGDLDPIALFLTSAFDFTLPKAMSLLLAYYNNNIPDVTDENEDGIYGHTEGDFLNILALAEAFSGTDLGFTDLPSPSSATDGYTVTRDDGTKVTIKYTNNSFELVSAVTPASNEEDSSSSSDEFNFTYENDDEIKELFVETALAFVEGTNYPAFENSREWTGFQDRNDKEALLSKSLSDVSSPIDGDALLTAYWDDNGNAALDALISYMLNLNISQDMVSIILNAGLSIVDNPATVQDLINAVNSILMGTYGKSNDGDMPNIEEDFGDIGDLFKALDALDDERLASDEDYTGSQRVQKEVVIAFLQSYLAGLNINGLDGYIEELVNSFGGGRNGLTENQFTKVLNTVDAYVKSMGDPDGIGVPENNLGVVDGYNTDGSKRGGTPFGPASTDDDGSPFWSFDKWKNRNKWNNR